MLQGTARGILDTVIKGLEGKQSSNSGPAKVDCSDPTHLEAIFSKPLSLESSTDTAQNQEVIELNIGSSSWNPLFIAPLPLPVFSSEIFVTAADDIDIDGPVTVSSLSPKPEKDKRGAEIILLRY